ncbi:MAG: hypothetical protein KF889_25440 [Alphaproteobacteria bacterium]|nr:hypothetical protein [Alphaproteobacteria bacterium]MCW5739662.1 hypothetical protein [Alphaproteobacteria bacterium]
MSAEPRTPLDVADQKQVQDRARSAKDRQKELDAAIMAFMSHKQGRAWVWDMLGACGLYRTSARSGDPHMTYFHEGERNVGLRLLAQLQRVCPDHFKTMTEENADA